MSDIFNKSHDICSSTQIQHYYSMIVR